MTFSIAGQFHSFYPASSMLDWVSELACVTYWDFLRIVDIRVEAFLTFTSLSQLRFGSADDIFVSRISQETFINRYRLSGP